MRSVRREPLRFAAAFRQTGRPGPRGIGAGKWRCPLWDRIRVFGNQWVAGVRLLCVHTFSCPPTAAVAPATWSPAPMAHIIRGRTGAGKRCAGHAGTIGQCADRGTAQIPAWAPKQASGDCPADADPQGLRNSTARDSEANSRRISTARHRAVATSSGTAPNSQARAASAK